VAVRTPEVGAPGAALGWVSRQGPMSETRKLAGARSGLEPATAGRTYPRPASCSGRPAVTITGPCPSRGAAGQDQPPAAQRPVIERSRREVDRQCAEGAPIFLCPAAGRRRDRTRSGVRA